MIESYITLERIAEAANYVREHADVGECPFGGVLGSGLGELGERIEDATIIDYADIPHMPKSTTPLHHGRLIVGNVANRPVVVLQGRVHAYEGYSAQEIAFPIYLLHELGVQSLVVTNAAGAINESFNVGNLMLIEDHINMLFANPGIGLRVLELHDRFYDMSHAYDPYLRQLARAAAKRIGITLQEGVYIATPGPSFETPAEIRAFRALGADAVGMSTVLEVIAARALEMRVLGISMISNPAAGMQVEPLDIEDVTRAASSAAYDVGELLVEMICEG